MLRWKIAVVALASVSALPWVSAAQERPASVPGVDLAREQAGPLLPAQAGGDARAEGKAEGLKPARLVVFNREIATLRTPLLGFSPDERVAAAVGRIGQQTDADVFGEATAEPLRDGVYSVNLAGKWMFYVLPTDVNALAGETASAAAEAAARRLSQAVAAVQEQRDLPRLARSVGVTLGALVVLLLLLRGFRHLARRSRVHLRRLAMRQTWKVSLLGFSLLDGSRLLRVGKWWVGAISGAAGAVLVYFWVTYALYQFPYTRPWSDQVHHFPGKPQL